MKCVHSQQLPDDVPAVAAFKKALDMVELVRKSKEADTGKYKYTYADLVDVLGEVKRVCTECELAPFQEVTTRDGLLLVETTLLHSSNQTLTFEPIGLPLPRDPQALGSAITYLRRYALVTIFAMPVADDDGKAATQQMREEDASGYRSGAEARIHELFSITDQAKGAAVRSQFRQHFGMGLSDLPVSKHGDALAFVLEHLAQPKPEPEQPPLTEPGGSHAEEAAHAGT